MKGLFFLAVGIAALVWGLRYLRKREVEAFLDADMVDFHTFTQQQTRDDAPDPLMARAQAYAAMNPDVVTLQQQEVGTDADPSIDPSMAPDPHLYRGKQPFDEVSRNLIRRLAGILPPGSVMLMNVPLSEFVQAEDGDARIKLMSYRVGILVCESSDMRVLCGIQLKDGAGRSQRPDFIRTVFGDLGLPLLEFPVSADISEYELRDQLDPVLRTHEMKSCPRCQSAMTVRQAQKGKRAGEVFWVCSKFPDCRGVIALQ